MSLFYQTIPDTYVIDLTPKTPLKYLKVSVKSVPQRSGAGQVFCTNYLSPGRIKAVSWEMLLEVLLFTPAPFRPELGLKTILVFLMRLLYSNSRMKGPGMCSFNSEDVTKLIFFYSGESIRVGKTEIKWTVSWYLVYSFVH